MRYFLFLLVFTSFFSSFSKADSGANPADGNQVAQPVLADYHKATRAPGFSPITEIVDQDGNPVH